MTIASHSIIFSSLAAALASTALGCAAAPTEVASTTEALDFLDPCTWWQTTPYFYEGVAALEALGSQVTSLSQCIQLVDSDAQIVKPIVDPGLGTQGAECVCKDVFAASPPIVDLFSADDTGRLRYVLHAPPASGDQYNILWGFEGTTLGQNSIDGVEWDIPGAPAGSVWDIKAQECTPHLFQPSTCSAWNTDYFQLVPAQGTTWLANIVRASDLSSAWVAGYTWDAPSASFVPEQVCSTWFAGAEHVGRWLPDGCHIGWGHTEQIVTPAFVLSTVAPGTQWIGASPGSSGGRLAGGYENGQQQNICRATVTDPSSGLLLGVEPGKELADGCHVGFQNAELIFTTYEALAVEAPNDALRVYAAAPLAQFTGGAIAGDGTTLSAPAVVARASGEEDVAAQGPNNTLVYRWFSTGNQIFATTAAGVGTTFSAPTMVVRPSTGEVDIAARGPNNSLGYTWSFPGGQFAHATIAPAGSTYSAPSMIVRPTTGEVDIVALGPNNTIEYAWAFPGGQFATTTFGSAYSAPSIALGPNDTVYVAALGYDGAVNVYSAQPGKPFVGGAIPNSALSGTGGVALAVRSTGEIDIATIGMGSSALVYFWIQPGDLAWHHTNAAPAGTTYSVPSLVVRASGEADLAALGANNAVMYYHAMPGVPWSPPTQVGPAYNATSAPSLFVRASGEADIAVQGLP